VDAEGRCLQIIQELNLRGAVSPGLAEPVLETEPLALTVIAARMRKEATLSPYGMLSWSSGAGTQTVDAVVSLQRNGQARELAVRRLSEGDDSRVIPFLLLRLDDSVPAIRARAAEAVLSRLRPAHAAMFGRCVGLLAALSRRQRGQAAAALRGVRDFLSAPAQWHELAKLFRSSEPRTRLEAFRLAFPGDPEVVLLALPDADPRVRLWAMRTLCSRSISSELRCRGLPTLEASRDYRVRLMALKAGAAGRTAEELEARWLFDAHSSVRLEARMMLGALVPERPPSRTRERALAALLSLAASPAQRTGALGTLADLGRAEDIELVKQFLGEPGPVRKEARRTLRILGGLGG